MNPDKYRREIRMLCPTCGCSQFERDSGVDQTIEMMKCASCGRELTKDELKRENSENINAHFNEMKGEVVKDMKKEIQDTLKKAFAGSKHIKFTMK